MLYHRDVTNNISGWWFRTFGFIFHILRISSSHLTNMFQDVKTTNQCIYILYTHNDVLRKKKNGVLFIIYYIFIISGV